MWAAARVWAWVWAWAVGVARLSSAMPSWQSCKAECESHFTNTDLLQAALSATCGRGCDMFTLALITTPQRTRVLHLGPVAMPPRPPPPPPRSAPHDLVVEVEEQVELGQAGVRDPKPRQTTTQPADHPVQDHPAHHQPTTNHPESTSDQSTSPLSTTTFSSLPPADPTHSDSEHHNAIIILGADSLQQETGHVEDTAGQKVGEAVGERERLQKAKDSCRHACGTAYQVSAEREACVVGCHLQAATAAGGPRPQPRSPLAYIQHVMVSLAGHVSRLVRVTSAWTSGASQSRYQDTRQLGHHYQPQQHQHEPSQEAHKQEAHHHQQQQQQGHHQREGHHSQTGSRSDDQRGRQAEGERQQVAGPRVYYSQLLGHYTIGAGVGVVLPDPHSGHHDCRHRHVTQQSQHNEQDKTQQHTQHDQHGAQETHHHSHHHQQHQHQQQQTQQTQQGGQQQLDLLECISRKAGLPRWFIAVTIFASALVILWLCFTLTAPPEDIKVVKTKPPELELEDDLDDYLEDALLRAEKKQLLAQADDVIKIKIENV